MDWTFDGTNLSSLAYGVKMGGEEIGIPGRRGENMLVPGRDGRVRVDKWREERSVSLAMWVRDVDPSTGGSASEAQLRTNLDTLLTLFGASGEKALSWTQGGVTRTGQAEVVSTVSFEAQGGRVYGLVVEFVLADPLWRATSATTSGPTTVTVSGQTIAITNAGTAVVGDAVITIEGAITDPRLTVGSVWVQWTGTVASGETLVIDCSDFTAELDSSNVAGSITHSGSLRWLELVSGSNSLAVTGTIGSPDPTVTVVFTAAFV